MLYNLGEPLSFFMDSILEISQIWGLWLILVILFS